MVMLKLNKLSNFVWGLGKNKKIDIFMYGSLDEWAIYVNARM